MQELFRYQMLDEGVDISLHFNGIGVALNGQLSNNFINSFALLKLVPDITTY
ncbi:MAG: hypothetical protein ABSA39_19740 [Edaphobacter sp.]